jgi:hypothetical protein
MKKIKYQKHILCNQIMGELDKIVENNYCIVKLNNSRNIVDIFWIKVKSPNMKRLINEILRNEILFVVVIDLNKNSIKGNVTHLRIKNYFFD